MKIEIDIPDREQNDNIYIFRNFELVAKKMYGKSWEIKTSPCIHCGICCKRYRNGCQNLEKRNDGTWWCKSQIPIFCLTANAEKVIPECVVKWTPII